MSGGKSFYLRKNQLNQDVCNDKLGKKSRKEQKKKNNNKNLKGEKKL